MSEEPEREKGHRMSHFNRVPLEFPMSTRHRLNLVSGPASDWARERAWCDECNGDGEVENDLGDAEACRDCLGSGVDSYVAILLDGARREVLDVDG